MNAATVPAVYASALLELADERGVTATVLDEVRDMIQSLEGNPELSAAVNGGDLPRAKAKALLTSIWGGRVRQELLDLLCLLVDRGRFPAAPAILRQLLTLVKEREGRIAVAITTAVPLSAAATESLLAALRRVVGPSLEAQWQVDPSLLGGVRLRYGDTLVDASVRRRLDDMKQSMLHAPVDGVEYEAGFTSRYVHSGEGDLP